jgi:hypothetical protein
MITPVMMMMPTMAMMMMMMMMMVVVVVRTRASAVRCQTRMAQRNAAANAD